MGCLLIVFCLSSLVLSNSQSGWRSPYHREDQKLGDKVKDASYEYIAHDVFNTSSPKCTSRDGHKVRCFFATSSSSVGYAIFSDKKLQGVWDFGGNVKDQPQVADLGHDGSFAFFIDDNHHIVAVGIDTNTTFDQTPTLVSQERFIEAPTCVQMAASTMLFCLARGMDGYAKSFRLRNGTWAEPVCIGRNPNSPISCAVNPVARLIHCWTSYGTNNAFSERLWSLRGVDVTSHWRGFGQHSRGRPCVKIVGVISSPRALANEDDRMVDQLRQFKGDDVFSEPECTNANSHTYDCFVFGSKGQLQHMVQYVGLLYLRRASNWVSYEKSELYFKGNPSCLYLAHDQQYHCYMTSRNNTLYEGVFEVVDPNQRTDDMSVEVAF